MFLKRESINIGEHIVLYVEHYHIDTPVNELKPGDIKFDNRNNESIYAVFLDEESGWLFLNQTGGTWQDDALRNIFARVDEEAIIFRVLNNDPDFNPSEYVNGGQ